MPYVSHLLDYRLVEMLFATAFVVVVYAAGRALKVRPAFALLCAAMPVFMFWAWSNPSLHHFVAGRLF